MKPSGPRFYKATFHDDEVFTVEHLVYAELRDRGINPERPFDSQGVEAYKKIERMFKDYGLPITADDLSGTEVRTFNDTMDLLTEDSAHRLNKLGLTNFNTGKLFHAFLEIYAEKGILEDVGLLEQKAA